VGVAVFMVAFLVTLSGQLVAVYANSDIAMAPYVSQLWLKAGDGTQLLMGHAPFYVGLWIFKLLHQLPDYRLTWELAPWILSVVASLILARTVFHVAGRTAALLVGATLICAGADLLPLQFAWGIHSLAYVNIVFLGAFVVWLSREPPNPILLWPVALMLAALTAAGVATDKLVIVGGEVPFVVTGVPMAWHALRTGRRRVPAALLTVVVGSIVGAPIVQAMMRSERLSATAFPIHAAAVGSLPSHLLLLVQSVFSLLNGFLHEPAATQTSPEGVLGYLCAAAVACLVALAASEAAALLRWVDAQRRTQMPNTVDRPAVGRYVNTAFWSTSAVALCVIYVGTTLPLTILTRRYLVPVAYGIVVLGITRAATAGRKIRILTLASVATLLLAGISGVVDGTIAKIPGTHPTAAMARAVDRVVAAKHAEVVYAGYWDAYALGWLGASSVRFEPVFTYGARLVAGVGSGAGFGGTISPRRPDPGGRSLLLLDRTLDNHDGMSALALSDLGPPAAHLRLDRGRLDAYLFDYDIATRFYR
jgi:hypothetical protein